MNSLNQQFSQFLTSHPLNDLDLHLQITSDRLAQLLYRIITAEFNDPSSFGNDYFKEILHQVAETILNVVYRKQQILVPVEHIVAYTSVMQFLIHSIPLPLNLLSKLEKYLHSFIVMQSLPKMRTIQQDSLNSPTIANFYKNIYISAYEHRCRTLFKEYGIQQKSCFMAIHMLQGIIEKSEIEIQRYESNPTGEWVILSLIYYILAAKCEQMKQTPILSKILRKYYSCKEYDQCQRQIEGNELCHFYNNIVLEEIAKIQSEEIDKMVEESDIDLKITSNFTVTPILSDNNTVLDNIVFSSSWEP